MFKVPLKTELLVFIGICLLPNQSAWPKIGFDKYLLNECRIS